MVYVLLVDGFEEVEAIEPIDILRRCGVEVKTVGVNGKMVTGSHNITVMADIEMSEVNREEADLVMLPGGPGHGALEASAEVMELVEYCSKNDKYISAICASPSILGKHGYLDGKRATCFPGFEEMLKGAKVSKEKAVTDGKIITGKGAGAAAEFGFAMAELLAGKEKAAEIKSSMQY